MNVRKLFSVFAVAWIAFGPRVFAVPSSQPSVLPPLSPAIAEVMEQLGADDPRQREDATARLGNFGELIRPALLEASRHAELPEVRFRAARLLCTLSWSRPEDSPAVAQVLGIYRSADPDTRLGALARLTSFDDSNAFNALLRLLGEEPSDDVRWAIASRLRRETDESRRRRLRELNPSPDDSASMAAAAWGWQSADAAKFSQLLRGAIDAYERHPSEDWGEINFALRTLEVRAINAGSYDDAAALKRRQIRFSTESPPIALLDLFALHAQFGPLEGFDRDLKVYEPFLGQPEFIYIFGRLQERQGHQLLAGALYRAAAAASLSSQVGHKRVADFLMTRGWYQLAGDEFRLALASPGEKDGDGMKEVLDADAIVGLSRSASGMGDEAEAVEQLKRFLDFASRIPGRTILNRSEYEAELAWHELRAARDANNPAAVAEHVDSLLAIHIGNPEAAIDVVVALKSLHREQEAANLFKPFFDSAKSQLDRDPRNPEYLNNLAWLCCRCNEHVAEAAKWSAEAVNLGPGNSAYLDTAAEACAHVGRWEDAVRLETSALRLRAGDRFMMNQLARFRDGAAKATKP